MFRSIRLISLGMLLLIGLMSFQALTVTPANAATINSVQVGCTKTTIAGNTEVAAKYVRVQIVLASNLSKVLATKVIATRHRAGASYTGTLNYTRQPAGTLLVISVGEWDGRRYVRPATTISRNCGQAQATQTPILVPTNTPLPDLTGTAPAPEYINYFIADQTVIPAGGCVTLWWHVVGAQQTTLLGSNWPDTTPMVVGNPDQGTFCPSAAGNYVPGEPVIYTLIAHYLSGGVESRSITVTYETTSVVTNTPSPDLTGTAPAPEYINYFIADQTVIPAGGCVTLWWHVVGAQQTMLLGSNWPDTTPMVVGKPDQTTICPSAAGNYVPGEPVIYTLTAHYLSGGVESRSIIITYQ
jgi:hypothetical protein